MASKSKGKSRQPRAKRQSDDVYNARRRYRRQAERYQKKAQSVTGLERARYEAQAREAISKAMATYGVKSKPQGQVARIAAELGVTENTRAISTFAKGFQAGMHKATQKQITNLIQQSFATLAGRETQSRDMMAKSILSVGNVGSRFYGGLVEIWGQDEESRKHPNKAILDYFGVNSLMDVLEQLEDNGIDLYTPTVNDDVYVSAQLKLQQYVLTHRSA